MNAIPARRAGAHVSSLLSNSNRRHAQNWTRHFTKERAVRPVRNTPNIISRPFSFAHVRCAQQPGSSTSAPLRTNQIAASPKPPVPATAGATSNSSPTAHTTSAASPNELSQAAESESPRSLTDSLADPPPVLQENERQVDWTRSFHGLSASPFSPEAAATLTAPIEYDDIEIKPDGIIYLPEIKYRRILNKAFGPGGWGLAPRGETIVTGKVVTREYGLVAGGRLVSIARGEQTYFDPDGIPTATEGCKSNALMRCCKDLGIASELWDPRYIKKFMAKMGKEMIVEHQVTRKRKKHWMRKDDELKFPLKEVQVPGQSPPSK
ncbi:hypothetical protein LTR66_007993 [Elasticomyces elasticus]|nr:hypothetical protein LTR66_007993 [Elasticomyces elasticus]KAK4993641.1 hypothetical protein LTR50_000252 [Elasticomyces elasticus]KAK5008963.1 hypothetical protein LTR28_003262 [Elasticomyces elasticus]